MIQRKEVNLSIFMHSKFKCTQKPKTTKNSRYWSSPSSSFLLAVPKVNKYLFIQELYHKALDIRSAIPHPRIMGIIRECGGKMHMREKEWEKAHTDFFEAFKNYDEAGSPRRIQCLKYLVLANMLMLSSINPFDSTEAKP